MEKVENFTKSGVGNQLFVPKEEKIKRKNDEKIKPLEKEGFSFGEGETQNSEEKPKEREVTEVLTRIKKNAFEEENSQKEKDFPKEENFLAKEKEPEEILEGISNELEFLSLRSVSI